MSKIAFVYPGQGSQYVGMGKEIYENFPEARAVFDEADNVLGKPVSENCFNGPEELLKDTRNAQPAILTTSVAIHAILKAAGVQPDFVAGHSLGEYSALVASETVNFTQALNLVAERSRLMAQADPEQNGTMAAVLGLSRETLAECLQTAVATGKVEAANFNCPGQIVISGTKSGIGKMQELVSAKGGKFIPLAVSGPFHSSFMKPAAEQFRPFLEQAEWRQPSVTLIANVDARPMTKEVIVDNLYRQIFSSVLWEDIVTYLSNAGVEVFVEVGPGKVLSGLIKKTVKGIKILNCEDSESIKKALAILKEV
ncbi:MAG TPA: ACP S-malonyltransferase [Bacillota bacterium]|nr:ACP S-malonyltransferase [Bacillota bacterium]